MNEGENVCEHGDHPAPAGKRFCGIECEACELGKMICLACALEDDDRGLDDDDDQGWEFI